MSKHQDFDFLFKVVLIGDSGVGKTNLLSRFVDNEFSTDSKPTIGVQFGTKTLKIDNSIIKNQIWDTAGQQRFRAITCAFYRGAVGAIIVFDLTRHITYQHVQKWISQARQHCEPNIKILLVGNKSDLENIQVKGDEIENFAMQNKLLYVQTSAATGQNVDKAFTILINEAYQELKPNISVSQASLDVTTQTKQQKNSKIDVPMPPIQPITKINVQLTQKNKNKKQKVIKLDKKTNKSKPKKNCC